MLSFGLRYHITTATHTSLSTTKRCRNEQHSTSYPPRTKTFCVSLFWFGQPHHHRHSHTHPTPQNLLYEVQFALLVFFHISAIATQKTTVLSHKTEVAIVGAGKGFDIDAVMGTKPRREFCTDSRYNLVLSYPSSSMRGSTNSSTVFAPTSVNCLCELTLPS